MHPLWAEFRGALTQPEYLHVVLNPVPVYGLATATAGFAASCVTGRRSAQAIALGLIILTAAAAGPAAHFGHQGYDRVYSLSDPAAQKWLNWHKNLGQRIVWVYYAAAAIAGAAELCLWKQSRFQRPVKTLAMAAAIAAVSGGSFLAFVGGKIRHPEFRDGPPPGWADTAGDYDR